ncbi:hypothetical protein BSKO_14128 [Bryopsis sp. KO-2023]|nr:hypothetical protein BSKO_14128 [Bryopsis sp. KO-2023]
MAHQSTYQDENLRLQGVLAQKETERRNALKGLLKARSRVRELEQSQRTTLERCAALEKALEDTARQCQDAVKEAKRHRYHAGKAMERVKFFAVEKTTDAKAKKPKRVLSKMLRWAKELLCCGGIYDPYDEEWLRESYVEASRSIESTQETTISISISNDEGEGTEVGKVGAEGGGKRQ